MNSEDLKQYIPCRPEGQRVWVVRASSGQFVEHFARYSLVAIGHVDQIPLSDGAFETNDLNRLEQLLFKADPDRSRGSITSHVNQVKAFVLDMKVGDLVVTLDSYSLMVGRVNEEAFIDRKKLTLERFGRYPSELTFRLRRSVNWGPRMRRGDVPAALEMTLLAHQTVFNLDDHWEAIYHLIYPFFFHRDTFFLSTKIAQQEALDNFSIAQLFGLLSGIEAVAKTLSANEFTRTPNYLSLLSTYVESNRLTLTSQAEFMSPGTIWSRVKITPKGMACAALMYAMLFGAKTPLIETDGVLDKELRHMIFELVKQMATQHQLPRIKQDLEIGVPSYNTEALRDKSLPPSPRALTT
jgi:hypothetical protein